MQSVGWYVRRLKSMSPAEASWRVRAKLGEALDRVRYPMARKRGLSGIVSQDGGASGLDSRVLGSHLWATEFAPAINDHAEWRAALLASADQIASNRIRLFDLDDVELGDPVRWNHEYKACKDTPTGFSPSIDYRDYALTGDCKFVWELSRHHQLVVLARAYRISGQERYAEKVAALLASWMDACPLGTGMNWRSPLELGIRLINWLWAVELVRRSPSFTPAMTGRVLGSVHQHLHEISRKYSRFSSANNHLIGEAAGVFIGSHYFSGLGGAEAWGQRARRILIREIHEQTYVDGGTREQAFGYHLFVTQFFLLAALVGRRGGAEFPQSYWKRLERMFEFVAAFLEGGAPPLFGDADDGYVLDLGGPLGRPETLMAVGAVLFDRPDFASLAGGLQEAVAWLFGGEGLEALASLAAEGTESRLHLRSHNSSDDANEDSGATRSKALTDSGYYLLQCDLPGSDGLVSVSIDCGELGFKSIAAHGHADALSVTLRVGGVDVLVDSGTYDYFTYSGWRDYFRSTRAHNTVELDGVDQSPMMGSFLWGRPAVSKCLDWSPTADGGRFVGTHDGYRRLADAATHRRTVALTRSGAGADGVEVSIEDQISSSGSHEIAWCLHFGESCQVEPLGDHRFVIRFSGGVVHLAVDRRLSIEFYRGCAKTHFGWVSRAYHCKKPTTTLVGRCRLVAEVRLDSRFSIVGLEAGDWNAARGPNHAGIMEFEGDRGELSQMTEAAMRIRGLPCRP